MAHLSEKEDNFCLSMTNSCVQTELSLNFKEFLKQRVWFFCSKLTLGMALFLTSTVTDQIKKLLLVSQFSIEILKYFYQKLENTEYCHQVFPTYFSL